MSGYGSFGGDAYVPPAVEPGAVVIGAPVGPSSRPLILQDAAVVESDGATRVRFTPPQPRAWLVHRITVTSDTTGQAFVYVGEPIDENIVSGTNSGDFDENETSVPYVVPEGGQLVIEWPSGGACRARIEYRET